MLDKFFDHEVREARWKILVYPNITFPDDLEKDSYVVVIKNAIEVLNKMRNDLFFTFLTPKYVKSLEFPNSEQLILPIPSFPNAMRLHFDFPKVYSLVDWRISDYDIVYSHLPEHTLQLSNLFNNSTNIRPRMIGYCHWFEFPENVSFIKRLFELNILGILEMEECGVNSVWLKSFVLDRAKATYNKDVLKRLETIIQPHYLGVDVVDVTTTTVRPKTILFNHRDGEYTGFGWFIKCMDKLYEKRQDFTVYTTLAQKDRPYLKKVTISDRKEYLDFIKSMTVGVGCFKKYSAWSIATTDGLSKGVPFILPRGLCYPEMVASDYPLLYTINDETDFLGVIGKVLDSDDLRNKALESLRKTIPEMTWDHTVKRWFNNWEGIFDESKYPTMSESGAYKRIKNIILSKGVVTKKEIMNELNWSMRIGFSPYRNRLRLDKDIMFTRDGYRIRG
jgi:glycosyltransferase involved in cell wall biosynthesis